MLDDTGGEIALLRAVSNYRPLGLHRHFNMISIVHALRDTPSEDGTPREPPSVPAIWAKLGQFYDLDGLNELVRARLMQDEGNSDDEDMPQWIKTYPAHTELLAKNEGARTRVLENMDEEEFALHPPDVFEPLIEPRRYEKSEAGGKVVPPSSEDDLSDMDSGSATDREDRASRARTRADTRRGSRKRQHNEEQPEVPASPETARSGKRRKAQGDENAVETPARPITRRQRQLEDEMQDEAGNDTQEADPPVAGSTRSARRAASSAAPTPEPQRVAHTRSASKSAAASPARSSPTPAARTRTRRDTNR